MVIMANDMLGSYGPGLHIVRMLVEGYGKRYGRTIAFPENPAKEHGVDRVNDEPRPVPEEPGTWIGSLAMHAK